MRKYSLIIFAVVFLLTKCDDVNEVGEEDKNEDSGEECKKTCPKGEEAKKEIMGNHCYYWSTIRKSWRESEQECENKDGHLAAVTSLEIHNFLMKRVNKDNPHTWFWIGGSDREAENTWKWADGSPWNFTHWANESRQQPNRAGNNHDCLQIFHKPFATNGWNDQSCVVYRNFICSWKICSASGYTTPRTEEPGDNRLVKPGDNSTQDGNFTTAGNGTLADIFGMDNDLQAAGILSALVLPVVVLIIIIICCVCKRCKKKKETKKEENLEVDENPVYQQYQFVGEDYESLERQYSTHEAVDRNIYYEQVN